MYAGAEGSTQLRILRSRRLADKCAYYPHLQIYHPLQHWYVNKEITSERVKRRALISVARGRVRLNFCNQDPVIKRTRVKPVYFQRRGGDCAGPIGRSRKHGRGETFSVLPSNGGGTGKRASAFDAYIRRGGWRSENRDRDSPRVRDKGLTFSRQFFFWNAMIRDTHSTYSRYLFESLFRTDVRKSIVTETHLSEVRCDDRENAKERERKIWEKLVSGNIIFF